MEAGQESSFYEGFDNMVWGGDVVAGEDSFGMNPVAGDMTIKSGRALSGYETPLYPVSYEMAGAGYIQESNLSVTEGKDVSGRDISRIHISRAVT